jgi:hypothetical protein
MNSIQPSRYINRRLGNNLNQIPVHNGIILKKEAAIQKRPSALTCPWCYRIEGVDKKFCSKLKHQIFDSKTR